LDRIEQERKRKLKEANDFNKKQVQQVIQNEAAPASEAPYMFGSVYEKEKAKRKAFEKEMMQFYQEQENVTSHSTQIKRQQRANSMRLDEYETKRKEMEAAEYEERRKREFQRLNEAQKQNMHVYNHVGSLMKEREKQEEQLIKNIVVDGGLKN
jgi:hypothetical protein